MKEIISFHIGQAGNQIGFSIWELLCAEHGILRNGTMKEAIDCGDKCQNAFFSESHCKQFVPRALFIDLEPTIINQLKTGSYRGLYNPTQLINGNDDSSGNFSRAFNTMGRLLYHPIESKLRKQVENCDNLQSLLFYRSLAGGSGSGLTSMIFEILEEYSKTIKIELPIHPSPHFDSCVVGPYNSILGEHFCMEECDVGLLLDNEALFDICCNILCIKSPTMTNINRIIGQVNSCITATSRYGTDMFNDLNAILTNLVPYPRIHFPLISFAPLASPASMLCHTNSITNITRSVFELDHQLVKCDPLSGKYMACSLVYRGLVNACEVYSTLRQIKEYKSHKFVDWCPTGFKIGIVDQPPLILPQSGIGFTKCSVSMLTNSSAVSVVWQRLAQNFHRLYAKRSFIHWFISEGLDESEFCEALYNLASLAKDYEEVSIDTSNLQSPAFDEGKEAGEGAEGAEGVGPEVVIDSADEGEGKSDDEEDEDTNGETNSSNFNSNCIINSIQPENVIKYEEIQSIEYYFLDERKANLEFMQKSEYLNCDPASLLSVKKEVFLKRFAPIESYVQFAKKSMEINKSHSTDFQQLKQKNDCDNIVYEIKQKDYESDNEEESLLVSLINKTQII